MRFQLKVLLFSNIRMPSILQLVTNPDLNGHTYVRLYDSQVGDFVLDPYTSRMCTRPLDTVVNARRPSAKQKYNADQYRKSGQDQNKPWAYCGLATGRFQTTRVSYSVCFGEHMAGYHELVIL